VNLERFFLYCNADGTCSLKREGDQATLQRCDSLVDGVAKAQDMKGDNSMQLTVFDPEGKVMLRSFA
jgi:hypothetical protein